MLETQLHNLGFHKNEIKVYLALFELGQCKAGDIIQHTKLHRNLVYTALEDLEKRELISKTLKGGVAEFSANDPKHLLDEIENKKQLAQTVIEELKNKQLEAPREVKVYEGIEGLEKFKEKSFHLKPNDPCYIISTTDQSETPELTEFWKKYHTKRAKKNIPAKFLFDHTTSQGAIDWRTKLPNTEAKYLPFATSMPIWLEMFGDYLGIGFPGKDPLMFSIKSQEAVDGFKGFFEYFWNNKATTLYGEAGARQFFNDTLNYSDVYFIGGNGGVEKFYPKVWDEYKYERLKRRVFWHDLITPGMNLSSVEPKKTILTEPYYEYKYLPETVANPHVICIYGNKVASIVWKKDSVINIIEDKEVAQGYKKYFDLLWNQQITVETGLPALKKAIYEMLDELKSGEEYLVLGASAGDETSGVQELYDKFHHNRIKKGVITKMLVYRESLKRIKERFDECGDTAYKVSHVKTYSTAPGIPMQINMYHDKAFMVLYGTEPSIIHFKKTEIYDGFKKYFEELWNQETTVTKGFEAFANTWMELFDQLKPNDTYRVFGANFGDEKEQPKFSEFFRELHKKRIAKNIKGQILFQKGADQIVHKYKMTDLYLNNQEFKTFPFKNEFPVEIFFHQDTTLMLIQKAEPTLISIKNKDVAKSFEKYFNEFWHQETQIVRGPLELQKLFFEAIESKELKQIGARGYFMDQYPELMKEVMTKANQASGLKWKNIVDIGTKGHAITKLPWMKTKYNLSSIKNPNVIWLYGDKVAIANWAGDEPIIFISTNKQLIQSYNDYFEELWNKKP